MTSSKSPSLFRLILWPSLITLGISGLRLYLEIQGSVTQASGGRLTPLGISWLVFVFGAWFGWRLKRAGAISNRNPAWAFLLFLGLVATVAVNFAGLDRSDHSEPGWQDLRQAVITIVLIAIPLAAITAWIWPRLAWTLCLYGLIARLTVLGLTWFAKHHGYDTHYSKFGPAGIERNMSDTMLSASIAQMGFWVPFTIIAGTLAGSIAATTVRTSDS